MGSLTHLSTAARAMLADRWLIMAVLFLARTAMGCQFQSVATLSSSLVADLAIDYTQLGLLIGSYLLPGIFYCLSGRPVRPALRRQACRNRRTGPHDVRRIADRYQPVLFDVPRRPPDQRHWRRPAQRPVDENGDRLVRRARDRHGPGTACQQLADRHRRCLGCVAVARGDCLGGGGVSRNGGGGCLWCCCWSLPSIA